MKYKYVVILKKTAERATDLLSILLCFFSAFTFIFLGLPAFRRFRGASGGSWTIDASSNDWLSLAVGGLLLIGLILILLSRRRIRHNKVRYRLLLLLATFGWVVCSPLPWIGAFFFILVFLEYQTKRPLEIGFDNDRVVINTLFKQRFDWSAFNNVVLKDGLLTLDFKSNRLIQKEIADDDEDDDADEEEFNLYCRGRLSN